MTDHTTGDPIDPAPDGDEGRFDERLRAGLAALLQEASDPPPLSSSTAPALTNTVQRLAAIAAAIVVLVGVGVLVTVEMRRPGSNTKVSANKTSVDQSDTAARSKPDRPLEGTRWLLTKAEKDGAALELRPDRPIGLRFLPSCAGHACPSHQPFMTAGDACNGVGREYRIERDKIVLGKRGGSTLMACVGPLVDLLGTVFGAVRLTYVIDGDQLQVRVPGVDATLIYAAIAGPFPPTPGQVVDHGDVGGTQYRLVWYKGWLKLEVADANTAMWGGGSGVGEDPGRINDLRGPIHGRPYLFAIVPAASARVVYEPVGGDPQDLDIHRIDSKTSAVVGQFVHDGPAVWSLVAYDADGIELHRDRWGARSDFSKYSLEEIIAKAKLQRCCGNAGARITFADRDVPMSAGSSPLEPTAPRDPRDGMKGAAVVTLPDGSRFATGTVRDRTAVRFDCLGLRYEVQAPLDATARTIEVARMLNRVTGCSNLTIG